MNSCCHLNDYKTLLKENTSVLRWHQRLLMISTTLNLKDATTTNKALRNANKHIQMLNNRHNLLNSASVLQKTATLPPDI